jgi:hypothetical protein
MAQMKVFLVALAICLVATCSADDRTQPEEEFSVSTVPAGAYTELAVSADESSASAERSPKRKFCRRHAYKTRLTKCYNRKYSYKTRHPYKKAYNKCWNQVHRRWVNKPYPAIKRTCYNRKYKYVKRYPVSKCKTTKTNRFCKDGCTTRCHATCSVTVYKHCNYGGYRINLKPGAYDMRTLMAKGMKNDDLSSIRVHGRCVARMYQHHHFGGKVLVKNRNDSCFTNDYMFPMSQLSQLVVHHADEKPELAQETSQAGWGRHRRSRRRRARRTSFNDQISSIKVYGGRRCYRRCRRCKRRLSCRMLWRAKWAYKNQRRCYNRRVIKYRRYLAHHTVRRCKRMYVTRYKWVNRYKTKRVCRRFWVTRYRTYCKWVLSSGGKKKTVSKCMRKWRCGVSGLNTPVSIAADGNVQCMSTNGKDCWWGKCRGKSVPRHGKLRPLVCGAMHKKKWGGNGYKSKGHWCNKVKKPIAKMCMKRSAKRNPKTGKVCNSKAGAICHGFNLKFFKSSLSQCKKACKADKRCNLAEYKAKSKHCCTSAIATKKQCKGRWAKANGWVGYNICR